MIKDGFDYGVNMSAVWRHAERIMENQEHAHVSLCSALAPRESCTTLYFYDYKDAHEMIVKASRHLDRPPSAIRIDNYATKCGEYTFYVLREALIIFKKSH